MNDQSALDDPQQAARIIAAILPDRSERLIVLKQLLASADYAQTISPTVWSVTLESNYFRMNVGKVEVLVATGGSIRMNCVGTVGVPPFEGEYFNRASYRSVVDPKCDFNGPISEFALVEADLQPSHREFIDIVARKKSGEPVAGSNHRKSHNEGLMIYARSFVEMPDRQQIDPTEDSPASGLTQPPIDLSLQQAAFWASVEESLRDSPAARQARLRVAPKLPTRRVATTVVFIRNNDVVAEVLDQAQGQCQRCHRPAPFFKRADGRPYLEVHHRTLLAEGGEDTVENAIALCPNCHRELHHGASTQ